MFDCAMNAVISRPGPATARTRVATALQDGTVDLPVLPRVAQEVLSAAQDPGRGAADVARHIERDAALCATVLRAANSAIYGGSVEIVSARQAVARLGMVEVASLAMSAAVRSAIGTQGPRQAQIRQWWRRSLATGLFAKEIARTRRHAVDSAFLCGLLGEVGVPVVLRLLEKYTASPDEVTEIVAEFSVGAGLLLCDGWRLAAPVRATVAHGASEGVPEAFGDHVYTAQLASAFASSLVPDGDASRAVAAPGAGPQAAALNLYPEDLERIAQTGASIAQTLESVG